MPFGQALRKKWNIICEGVEVPPPIRKFKDMRFPEPLLKALAGKGITKATPIQVSLSAESILLGGRLLCAFELIPGWVVFPQVQGLPVILSGRDMIGIAFTGSGKTITFSLPLIMLALTEETKMPIVANEGPFGIILCPSRELARQTFEVIQAYCDALASSGKFPQLRSKYCHSTGTVEET